MASPSPYQPANAYTFLDYANNSNDPQIQATYIAMIGPGSIWEDIPLLTEKTMKKGYTRITGDLAKPSWVPIGDSPVVQKNPSPEWTEEGVFTFRNGIPVDQAFIMTTDTITDPFDLNVKTALQGANFDLCYKLIQNKHEGDPTTDPRVDRNAFVGIRERLDQPSTYYTNPACLIDGGGVNIAVATSTGGDGIVLEALLEKALYEMGTSDGSGVTITMNGKAIRGVNAAVKKSGSGAGFRYDRDAYDREVEMFKNAKVIDCGRNSPVGNRANRTQTPVISETETANGLADTGGTFTSVYLWKTGMEDMYGWHWDPLKPSEPMLMNDGVTWQVFLLYYIGICIPNPRGVARIFNVDTGS